MKHPTDLELIELAAGRLCDEEAAQLHRHIGACEQCRDVLEELGQVWHQMGAWDVEPGERDVASRVEAAARQGWGRVSGGRSHRAWGLPLFRAAAAIVLGLAIGHAAGRLSLPDSHKSEPSQVGEAMVSDALHLGVLAELTPANLAERLIRPEDPFEREE